MKLSLLLTVLAASWYVSSVAGEASPDAIAKKLGKWNTWEQFEQSKWGNGNLRAVDSSQFAPAEIDFLTRWAREQHPPQGMREENAVSFIILLKFRDKKTLEYVDKQFSRGWHWAFSAGQALEHTGELSLLYLPAKYLTVEQASEPPPPMSDVLYEAAPCSWAAGTIGNLLRFSLQAPDAIKKAATDIAHDRRLDPVPIYRRWWAANQQRCLKGDFANLSSPSEYVTEQDKIKKVFN